MSSSSKNVFHSRTNKFIISTEWNFLCETTKGALFKNPYSFDYWIHDYVICIYGSLPYSSQIHAPYQNLCLFLTHSLSKYKPPFICLVVVLCILTKLVFIHFLNVVKFELILYSCVCILSRFRYTLCLCVCIV